MERRSEPRYSTRSPVRVLVLTEPERDVEGSLADLSGAGLQLRARAPVAVGAAIRVDVEDSMLLGEVCYCRPAGEEYAVGVRLDQALNGVGEITRLARQLLRESSGDLQRGDALYEANHEHADQGHEQRQSDAVGPAGTAETRLQKSRHRRAPTLQ